MSRQRSAIHTAVIHIWLPTLLLLLNTFGLNASSAHAQAEVGSYTVQSGDTLAVIAERFGVGLDALIALNNIQDRNLIAVGQVLLIPGADAALGTVNTARVMARPGDTLVDVVRRFAVDPQVVTALNPISMTTRLFPGQPIALPQSAAPTPPQRLGAITQITMPASLAQGRTGRLTVQATRPLSITATWNGLPLPLLPLDATGTEQLALLPVPALIAPAPYTVAVTYRAANGVVLEHDQQLVVSEGPYESQEIILPDDKGGLLDPEIGVDELALLSAVWSEVTPARQWGGQFALPIDPQYSTTSPYGTRRSYNGGPYSSYHSGQDFGAPEGVPILAPAAGRIALAAPLQVRGNAILIDHGGGVYTGYWHLSEFSVIEGQTVQAGDVLGLVGTTGLSTGAHLHWELRVYGIAVDPMQFINEPFLNQIQAQLLTAPN